MNFQLLGNRILIKLDEQPDHSSSEQGVIIPKFINTETEGGRPKASLDTRKHLLQGTVLQISPKAAQALADELTPLSPGDRVYVSASTNNSSYQFFLDRSQIVSYFDGHIAIPHALIEAKILN